MPPGLDLEPRGRTALVVAILLLLVVVVVVVVMVAVVVIRVATIAIAVAVVSENDGVWLGRDEGIALVKREEKKRESYKQVQLWYLQYVAQFRVATYENSLKVS